MSSSIRLGDHCSKIGSGATPRGGKKSYLSSGPFALIRSQNINNHRFIKDGLVFISNEQAKDLRNAEVLPEDILLSITGYIKVCQVNNAILPARVSQHVIIIRPDRDIIAPKFLRYYLASPFMQSYMLSLAGAGGTRDALTKGMVEDFQIPNIPIQNQRNIASTLSALDDKINLNRQMNETLESMARTLFKDWFVDFGPTRAKMKAREPYLAQEIWDLFPDKMDNEGKPKPEDWEYCPVGDFAGIRGGMQLEKKYISNEGPVPVFGGAGIMGYTTNHNAQGFVISFGRVGAYCGQFFSYRGNAWINNNASLVSPNSNVSGEWLLLALRYINIDAIKRGAAQPFVSNGDIIKEKILWSGDALTNAFSDRIGNLMKKIEANNVESTTLAQTRDLLLPKLVSGELKISDAEKFIEKVGI